jgi:zinc protease
VAVYASAFYGDISLDDTTFGLVIVPAEGVSLADAEAALDTAVAEFLDEGIDDAQLERIRTQIRASLIYQEDDIQALARTYGMALTSGLTIEDVEAWPEILKSVTEEEILDAATRVLDRRNAVTGWLKSPETEEVMQ